MNTIETTDGTVCANCLLWPDLCTCRPDHPARQIIEAVAPLLAQQPSAGRCPICAARNCRNPNCGSRY